MKIEGSVFFYPDTEDLKSTLIKIRKAQHDFKFFLAK